MISKINPTGLPCLFLAAAISTAGGYLIAGRDYRNALANMPVNTMEAAKIVDFTNKIQSAGSTPQIVSLDQNMKDALDGACQAPAYNPEQAIITPSGLVTQVETVPATAVVPCLKKYAGELTVPPEKPKKATITLASVLGTAFYIGVANAFLPRRKKITATTVNAL